MAPANTGSCSIWWVLCGPTSVLRGEGRQLPALLALSGLGRPDPWPGAFEDPDHPTWRLVAASSRDQMQLEPGRGLVDAHSP